MPLKFENETNEQFVRRLMVDDAVLQNPKLSKEEILNILNSELSNDQVTSYLKKIYKSQKEFIPQEFIQVNEKVESIDISPVEENSPFEKVNVSYE